MTLARLLTAMITPYNSELEVDYEKAADLASYLIENGSQGIVVCGTTGESPVLGSDEKLGLFEAVVKKVGMQVPVWAGVGSYNTAETVHLARAAEKTGVAGVMMVTPYYNKPTQEGIYRHFKSAAEAVSIPVMLYNIPGRTGVNVLPETMLRLSAIDNIVAIKEASGSMDQVSQLRGSLPEKVVIYCGDDSLTLPMCSVGAEGVVSIASHLVGKEILKMLKHFFAGEIQEARQEHLKLFPLFKDLFICTNPIPLKECLNMMGLEVGGLRLPLCEASPEERNRLNKLLQDYGLIKA